MEDFRRVTIEEAIELQATTNPLIHWRPKPNLPEPEQYGLVAVEPQY